MNVVNTFNDWDPLEEIIVGVLDGTVGWVPSLSWLSFIPQEDIARFDERAIRHVLAVQGKPAAELAPQYAAAKAELEELVRVLEAEGVTVRRPDPVDNTRPYVTPDWA